MRISVTRTGGFGGLARRAVLDTADRPDSDTIETLAREALLQARAERPVGVPDGFSYEIETDDSVGYCADPRLTEAQSALITRVLKEGSAS